MTSPTPELPPHAGQPVLRAGADLAGARAAVVLVHGRGGSALDMLGLVPDLLLDLGAEGAAAFAWRAPQAAGNSWYPYRFLAPLADNEPGLSSGLRRLEVTLAELAAGGVPAGRTVLLGFSQGACLSLEFAARHAHRFGGVVAFSGGLIGPPGSRWDFGGDLAGTPVFLGCSDRDPHIPRERVGESARVLAERGGQVTERIYPGLGHTVNDDELAFVRGMLAGLLGPVR